MRYYSIELTDPTTGAVVRRWTSYPNGKPDPRALQIEFDVLTTRYAAPVGGSTLTIYGVALEDLEQGNEWGLIEDRAGNVIKAPHGIEVRGGMGPGLPLANPKQTGVLFSGLVAQSWGNWEGTDMTLDFLMTPGGNYSLRRPAPIVLNWRAGQELGDALQQCLTQAFPENPVQVHVRTGLVQNHDEPGIYSTLDQFAQWVLQLTTKRFGNPVDVASAGPGIRVFDDTYRPTPIQLAFTDFVGQPTWIAPRTMQIKLVMRGDLQVGGLIHVPPKMQPSPGIVLTAASALPSSIRYKSTFTGLFQVLQLRHVGQSRSPDGTQWVTIANAVYLGAPQG